MKEIHCVDGNRMSEAKRRGSGVFERLCPVVLEIRLQVGREVHDNGVTPE